MLPTFTPRRSPRGAVSILVVIATAIVASGIAPLFVAGPAAAGRDGRVPPSGARSAAPPAAQMADPGGTAGVFADTAGVLATRLEHLPLITHPAAVPDDFLATAAYGSATLGNTAGLTEMYSASIRALRVSAEERPAVDEMLGLLVDDSEDVANQVSGIDAAFGRGMAALRGDATNADRLSNAGIALWSYGAVSAIDDNDEANWYSQFAAIRFLEAATLAFPDHRALLLNLAFLKATTADWGLTGDAEAARLIERDPTDLTARALLASIQSRRGDLPDGAERALATLQPMIADPATRALGEALAGDAHLAVASIRRAIAPEQSRKEAALALAAYDRAAESSGDPELQAGRSRALELLGDLAGAATAQEVASRAHPSVDFAIDVARLAHRSGDDDLLRDTAGELVRRLMAGWDPALTSVRYVLAPSYVARRVPDDRGYLGWSIGSAADHLPLTAFELITGGGPGVVIVDTVDLDFPGEDQEIAANLAPRSAWRLALTAAILDADRAAAERLGAQWAEAMPWDAFWGDWLDAARISAAGPADFDPDGDLDALDVAQRALVRARRAGDAAALCRRLGVRTCAGTNALRAREPGALAELQRAFEEARADTSSSPRSELRMFVAQAAELAGDTTTMQDFLADVAGANDAGALRVRAALRLGDLRLEAADPAGAATWYELALATIQANGLTEIRDYGRDAAPALEQRGLEQAARNNHGVALLRALQPDDATAPRCRDDAIRPRCEAALGDFVAASEVDPANAVYRMNIGWVARLLDRPEDARAALEAAVALDPTLYPAFNDLGVLLARFGDDVGARRAFEAAVTADPSYDLASWNLGILALRDVPAGLGAAQQRLADVIRSDPALRMAPLDFRTDERTYAFGFAAPLRASEGLPLGRTYSIGAVVLAGATSIAALAQLQATLVGHGIETATDSTRGWLERAGRRARWRTRQRSLRRRLPRGLAPWLPWLGVVGVLGLVSSWQAAQASPATSASAVVLTLAASAVAVVAHVAGHWIGARAVRGRVIPAAWTPGAVVSLLFVPVHAASGPFPAERLRLPQGGRAGAWRFHLAGPLANVLVAVAAYSVFLAAPAPVFRLVAQVQLAAIAYTLLPVKPLDGWAIKREHPRLLVALGFGMVAAGAAFALGIL